MKRRRWPVMIMVIGVLVLLGWYIGYTRHVVSQLRGAAAMQGRMYARIYEALQDTSVDADPAVVLLDLSQEIRESGLPLVVTDRLGRVTGTANIPRDIERDTARLRQFIVELDQKNPPIADRAIGAVHLGDNGIVTGLQVIPLLQAFGIVLLVGFGVYALIERGRAEREKVWAGMAREAAHQLGRLCPPWPAGSNCSARP